MFTYLVIDIHDHPDADIEQYFDECHAFIDKGPKPNLHLTSNPNPNPNPNPRSRERECPSSLQVGAFSFGRCRHLIHDEDEVRVRVRVKVKVKFKFKFKFKVRLGPNIPPVTGMISYLAIKAHVRILVRSWSMREALRRCCSRSSI